MSEEKQAALNNALGDITKRFGEGIIMRLGDARHLTVDAIPTGSLSLDIALGVTEIYGPESSGKTTITQHIVAEAQRLGGTAAFVDMEHALDPAYAEACGVDIENLLIAQPDMGEQALEITETLVRSGAVDVVVIDSVADPTYTLLFIVVVPLIYVVPATVSAYAGVEVLIPILPLSSTTKRTVPLFLTLSKSPLANVFAVSKINALPSVVVTFVLKSAV